jgi:two-component system LytT family response regulator
LQNQHKPHTKLALNTQEKIHIVTINDIVRCESNGNYTEFFFKEGKKLLVTKTMKEYEDLLSQQGFYRVHQSHLINTAYIKEFVKTDDELIMADQTRIPVSTRRRAEVMKMLDDL